MSQQQTKKQLGKSICSTEDSSNDSESNMSATTIINGSNKTSPAKNLRMKIKCIKQCKFDYVAKDNPLECSLCQEQYHRLCLKIKSTTTPRVWLCPLCKDIPGTVKNILQANADQQKEILNATNEIASLREMINDQKNLISNMQLTMRGLLAQPTCKCISNCKRDDKTTEIPTSNVTEQNIGSRKPQQYKLTKTNMKNTATKQRIKLPREETEIRDTLIVGDSIIRDIKDRGLKKAEVKCIRGGRIKHVKDSLVADFNCKSYKTVLLHVGTNNCNSDESFTDSISQYEDLVNHIKRESPKTDVIISTVCPRIDDELSQNRVNKLNAGLKQVAEMHKCKIIDNDETFILRNGSIAQSNLNKGGLHLSWTGTRMLLRNMESSHQILKNPLRNVLPNEKSRRFNQRMQPEGKQYNQRSYRQK